MKQHNINRVITPVNTTFGAPMGRHNVGKQPVTITSGKSNRIVKKNQTKVYDKIVRLNQGYDNGGAYWGIGKPLHVRFTADLSYIEFYRN